MQFWNHHVVFNHSGMKVEQYFSFMDPHLKSHRLL